ESLNSKLRDELLNGEIFTTLREAQVLIEAWRRHYNTVVNGMVNLTHPCRYRQLGTDPPVAIAVVPARGNKGSQTFSSSVVVLPAAAVGRAMIPARRLSFRR